MNLRNISTEFKRERFVKTFCSKWRHEVTYIEVTFCTLFKTWNNVNWSYCKHGYFYKRWYLAGLNLEKTIFKPKNETIYFTNDHLSRLKFYVTARTTVQELKKSAARKTKKASRSKQKEGQREITRFCSIICEFSIFLYCFL